ncbi:GNAT family N-acetyltransferase [Aestuariimicrobium sp. p3-SID1156]|uniref:GNAT family N-acetyltransferase n=1 Tax=Aestuariimicrobium sp. p3-SID1156 TaxID=2916038 RepID=UPI00223B8628|nr:GNAT family N-acetyltransferase [Aestuariimicrobium sp. p3-SID1156]MCT1459762.1 GNAT family N-acetyltransferase [Aestuariimicrobium sp. p3-SID1156]
MSDYRLEKLDPSRTTTPEQQQALDQWIQAICMGFLDPAPTEDQLTLIRNHLPRDGGVLRAMRRPPRSTVGEVEQPVATMRTWTNSINTGGGHVEPAAFITDVTVRQTDRRRGLLRTMMVDNLREIRDQGVALAALTATEATIYSRFGFGVSTFHHTVELDISHGFALLHEPIGPVVQLDPDSPRTAEVWEGVFRRFHLQTRGSHGASAHHLDGFPGLIDWETGKRDPRTRAVAHLDASGEPDGVLSYAIKDGELKVVDLVALDANAELAFWDFIGNHDLLTKATCKSVSVESPLRWALRDPRRLTVTNVRDGVWTRILDVPKALRVRGFEHDGEVTLGIDDPSLVRRDIVRLCVREGVTEVEPFGGEPELQMDVSALGSLYLGGVDALTLFGAGRITGSPEAAARLDALFQVTLPPHSARYF